MSGITRVTTLAQNTQNLLNLLRNEQSLNDVLLQQSTGLKAPTFAGVAPQAGQLLNVNALSSQAQGFLNNITSAQTTLNLTDTTLSSIGSLATNFQQELQQLQSSPTPPNISDLARTSLDQLASLVDSSDGTQFLFAGGQQNAPPVAAFNTTRIPTKTLTLAGNLDTQGLAPVNGNVAPPAAGSFVDVSLSGQNAVFDSTGHQYDTTVRFVHQSATSWQAYLVKMARTDDNSQLASFNGQPISESNPVALGKPFNPAAAAPQFNGINNPSAPPNLLQFDNQGTAGVPQIALPSGGGLIKINVDANTITNTAGASAFTQADNATPTTQIVLNQLNLDPTTPLGDTTSITLSGPNALFGANATGGTDKFNATISLTKVQLADATQVPPLPELWQAAVTSLTDATTGAAVTVPAITAAAPYVIGTFPPGQIPFTHLNGGAPFSIQIAANAGPATPDATGATFKMAAANNGSLTVAVRAGTVTTNNTGLTGTSISQFTVNPIPPPGSPQFLELSGNLSSATPVNISVSNPTTGSFADINFSNAQAVVDSQGNAHNLSLRILKTSTAPDLYQLYAVGMTAVETGKDSTNPPISLTNPTAIGAPFDPTAIPAGGTTLTFTPTLASGAAMSVTIPLTPSTFDQKGGNIVLTAPQNTTTTASLTPSGQLNLVGNLSSSAVANPAPTGLGSVTITAGSTGFVVGDTVTFNTPAGGSPAKGIVTAIGAAGAITGLQITNPGSGYAGAPTLVATSGAGVFGAVTMTAKLGPSLTDITTPIGALTAPLGVSAAGLGYVAGDKVTFAAPPGEVAATATVATVGAGGTITSFTLIDPGSGYTSTNPLSITSTTGVGTGGIATPTLSKIDANNTFDVNFSGNQVLRDSSGHAYDATVRVQYGSIGGGTAGWRAYLTSLTDPTTGLSALPAANLPSLIGTPPFDAFHPQDAALGVITIPANGPQVINIPGTGTKLSLTIPFNNENFSSNTGPSNLTVGSQSTTSLSANIADTTYFRPGGKVFDTSDSQLQFRTAADSVVKFGIRADNPAFEQLFRVLNFFKDQSVPASPAEVGNANQLMNSAINGINALRADVANTQTVLKSEQSFHQTTITLAQSTHDSIITADSATTAMNLNAISNLLQESFATLGVIKNLSLVNFLK